MIRIIDLRSQEIVLELNKAQSPKICLPQATKDISEYVMMHLACTRHCALCDRL
ncbi:hypothetical protein [Tumidithrix helvetica]|uniref:hypothetical protein n=1 Tax=Tumidithrix helvetica TaxID=3457545 RepID=UPI003CC5C300